MNINEINDAWVQAGQKVSDLNAKLNTALVDDEKSAEDIKDLKEKRDAAMVKRDALKEQLDMAREEAKVVNIKKPNIITETEKKDNEKTHFVDQFKGMIKNDPKVMNALTETDPSGNQLGLVVPPDVQVQINRLVRQYASLQQYVRVEATSLPSGSRVYEKWTDIKPLANLDDDASKIGDNDDPQLTTIKYQIHRYAGISTITNTLLNDTPDNLLAWITQWIAHKTVVTRNNAILNVLPKLTAKKPTINSMDDVRTLITTGVDPAIAATSFLMTNVSGFNELANTKDAIGRYYLDRDISQDNQYTLLGKKIIVIADRWLPNDGSGNHPLYYGDMKQAVTLFDRQQMSLLTTNVGGGAFENDETKIRVIDRFDVEATDGEAFVPTSFKSLAPSAPTTSVSSKG